MVVQYTTFGGRLIIAITHLLKGTKLIIYMDCNVFSNAKLEYVVTVLQLHFFGFNNLF